MKFYINDKRISRKELAELIGKEDLENKIEQAKEGFMEDPYEEQSWYIGGGRILVISYE